jgi:ubiquitin carboxyl-terminal hydrolase 9/24
MNALNEINQVIQNVTSHYTSHHYRLDEVEYLSSKRIAEWLAENQVLQIVLRDSLHQPQYVEKLEKILRFIIKERSLTLRDLDDIWAAQVNIYLIIVAEFAIVQSAITWSDGFIDL